jgi:DNA-binding response OmpR family regulator
VQTRTTGNGKRILLVEDDPSVRALVQRVLTAYGFTVFNAENGLAGLLRLERDALPDLVIADLMMPQLDGMSFVRAMKAREETKAIPVIFLTARTDSQSMIDGLNAGARFYITKPFQIEDLVGKVKIALSIA